MKKLVLSQTCQGAILRDLLLSSPELAEAYQCLFVPNYALEADAAKPAAVDTLVAELPNCDVLIYHDIAAFDFPARLAQLPQAPWPSRCPTLPPPSTGPATTTGIPAGWLRAVQPP